MSTHYNHIVVLTGAGISAESGLATFRGNNGMWGRYAIEDVASIEGFERNPDKVFDFYNELKPQMDKALPNAAHYALSCLQQALTSLRKTWICCTKKLAIKMYTTFMAESMKRCACTVDLSQETCPAPRAAAFAPIAKCKG